MSRQRQILRLLAEGRNVTYFVGILIFLLLIFTDAQQGLLMLDKPDIKDAALIACLRKSYTLPIKQIAFLPWGADRNTAVYRAVAEDGAKYFVKLRQADFI